MLTILTKEERKKVYELKSIILGPEDHHVKELRILNRVVAWKSDGIHYEGDQRHVEIGLEELGLMEGSRSVSTPGEKEKVTEEGERVLNREESNACRGLVARLNYLAQDRSDITYSAKELSREMAKPTKASWVKMERIHRYLMGAPMFVLEYKYQSRQERIVTWTDSDFAGCIKSRKLLAIAGSNLVTWLGASIRGSALLRNNYLIGYSNNTRTAMTQDT